MRDRTAAVAGYIEDGFYAAILIALAAAGVLLFSYALYGFIRDITQQPIRALLELLDMLLLVFIFTELIHTVRAVIAEGVLVVEPFLVVGIVAAIRRIVVISAEAKAMLGTPDFADAMLEIGVLAVTVILLGVTIFLLRRSGGHESQAEHARS
jgi:uncharacterized membrane protein (DUF373 family)